MLERFERFSFALSGMSRCFRKIAAAELSKYGLKSAHATYLLAMYKYPQGISVPEICETVGRDKSDASRRIALIEKKGLARKKDVGGSLYRGLWVLTDEGTKVAEQVGKRADMAVELAGKGLSDEMRESFYKAMESIVTNLNALSKSGLPDK